MKNRQYLQAVKPSIDVKKQLADHKKSKKLQRALKKPLNKYYVSNKSARNLGGTIEEGNSLDMYS